MKTRALSAPPLILVLALTGVFAPGAAQLPVEGEEAVRAALAWAGPGAASMLPATARAGIVAARAAPAEPSRGAPLLDGFDAFVASVMEEHRVPGVAVAVVKDGDVVLARGYGFRDVERQLPVTERTLFAIGSNTKSFTVNVVGQLVDEGKIRWDEPLRSYLPDFQLHDPVATREMTPRDLVTHRSGLPRHDLLWYGRSFTREELYRRLRDLEPSASFRSRYQYQNLMFMTAGILAERVTGSSWEDLVRERIFRPLGMSRSNFSVDVMARDGDASLPYLEIEDEVTAVPYRNIDAIGPAGSINSSALEMARYILMNIDGGGYGEARILAEGTAAEMQRPQMVAGGEPQDPELGYGSYGLGLLVSTYRGRKLVTHGGGIDGFISHMSWMPREKIGIMVLTNFSGFNPVPDLVARRAYDQMLELEPVDWAGRVRERRREALEREAERRKEREAARVEGTSPSHALEDYAGTYEHPGYGSVEVRAEGGALRVTFDAFAFDLEHRHYDVFEVASAPGVPMGGMLVQFGYDREKGTPDRLLVPLEPNVEEIEFRRREEG